MRKQTKLVAVLSAAALLAVGASMTSFAADRGWVEENGVWMYLDADGEAVVEEWKKSQGLYFWLDENGEMATEALVEDGDNTYYVDANGARVLNDWRLVDNNDGWAIQEDDEEPAQIYYYFGSNGRAVTGKKSIQGKTYFFDEDGQMFYGWYTTNLDSNDEKTYYLGEENEGWAYAGWQLLDIRTSVEDDYDEDEGWFNFKSNGEMRKDGRAYLDGSYYGFDENGIMIDGWRPDPDSGFASSTSNVFYTEDSGNQPKGWVFTYTYNDWSAQDDDQQWYYLNSGGRPFNVGSDFSEKKTAEISTALATKLKEGDGVDKYPDGDDGRYTGVAAKYIKKETYLFGSDGVMLTGVIQLHSDGTTRTYIVDDNGTEGDTSDDILAKVPVYARYKSTNPDINGEPVASVKGTPRIGGGTDYLADGIYYFNKNSGSVLGQMETGKVTVNYDGDNYYYNLRKKITNYSPKTVDGVSEPANWATASGVGAAYTNAIVDGCLYDEYGARVNADESREFYVISEDGFNFPIRDDKDVPIPSLNGINVGIDGYGVILSSSGKVTKSGSVTIDGTKYKVVDYIATPDYN